MSTDSDFMKCPGCGEEKPSSEFYERKNKAQMICKTCAERAAVSLPWRKKHNRPTWQGGTYWGQNENAEKSGFRYCMLTGVLRPIEEFGDGMHIHPSAKGMFYREKKVTGSVAVSITALCQRMDDLEAKLEKLQSKVFF